MSDPSQLETILTKQGFPKAKPLSSEASGKLVDSPAKPLDLIKYEKNLEDLRNTLGQIDSLLAGKQTPEIAAKCASLLGYVAAIDLPAEIKNQEAGRYPPQVQEQVAKTLESQNKNTDGQAAQSAAYSAAIMQRVSEEAQIRIQKEAALRVEASRLENIKLMKELDEQFDEATRNFLNSEYSEENKRNYIAFARRNTAIRVAGTSEYCEQLLKNMPNLSREDLEKEWRGVYSRLNEAQKSREKIERNIDRLEEEEKQYEEGSPEQLKCRTLIETQRIRHQGETDQCQLLRSCYQQVDRYVVNLYNQSKPNGDQGSSAQETRNSKSVGKRLSSFSKDQWGIVDASKQPNRESQSLPTASVVAFNDRVPKTSGSSMSSTLKKAESQGNANTQEDSSVYLAMKNSAVSGLG